MKSLESKDLYPIKLVSSVDGKQVVAEGYINEVSMNRHLAIYEAEDAFSKAKADYNLVEDKFTKGEILLDEFKAEFEAYSKAIPELFSNICKVIYTFHKGHPDITFFQSADLEYSKILRDKDFFLKLLRD
jgi:hypothetical protein